MKLPDGIKDALKHCYKGACEKCPYGEEGLHCKTLFSDALNYINTLEAYKELYHAITVRDILRMYDGDVKLFCWKDHNLWINGMASALLDIGDKLLDLAVDCIEPRHTQADNRTRLYVWTREAVAE